MCLVTPTCDNTTGAGCSYINLLTDVLDFVSAPECAVISSTSSLDAFYNLGYATTAIYTHSRPVVCTRYMLVLGTYSWIRSSAVGVFRDELLIWLPIWYLTLFATAKAAIKHRFMDIKRYTYLSRFRTSDQRSNLYVRGNSIILQLHPIWLPVITTTQSEDKSYPDKVAVEIAEGLFLYPDYGIIGGRVDEPITAESYFLGPFYIRNHVNIVIRTGCDDGKGQLHSELARITNGKTVANVESEAIWDAIQDAENRYVHDTVSKFIIDGDTIFITYHPSFKSAEKSSWLYDHLCRQLTDATENSRGVAYELNVLVWNIILAGFRYGRLHSDKKRSRKDRMREVITVDDGPLAIHTIDALLRRYVVRSLDEVSRSILVYNLSLGSQEDMQKMQEEILSIELPDAFVNKKLLI